MVPIEGKRSVIKIDNFFKATVAPVTIVKPKVRRGFEAALILSDFE